MPVRRKRVTCISISCAVVCCVCVLGTSVCPQKVRKARLVLVGKMNGRDFVRWTSVGSRRKGTGII